MSKQPQIPRIIITCPGGFGSNGECLQAPITSSDRIASKNSFSLIPNSGSYYPPSFSSNIASMERQSARQLNELQRSADAKTQKVKKEWQQERIKRGELYALPYDDNGNQLPAEALREKLETYWAKTNPSSISNSVPKESIEEREARFNEEIKQFKARKPFDFEAEKQKMLQVFEGGTKPPIVKAPNVDISTFVPYVSTSQSDMNELEKELRVCSRSIDNRGVI